MANRTYSELSRISSFEDRYKYLMLKGVVGLQTFGFDRWINQQFYRSKQWQSARDRVIFRDGGCDLGVDGFEIESRLMVHHMNPITADDIASGVEWILDPEYLITVSHTTHNAIHYGDESLIPRLPVERRPGDTRLW